MDSSGRIILLQSRPLRISEPTFQNQKQEKPEIVTPPLLNHGVRAVGGVAGGPVFVLHREEDIPDIPLGAVVVARQPSSRLVKVMDRIAAILTEVGSPTDHMTILAREFQVPTLVDVTGVLATLVTGQQVTVDADLAAVYPGIIPELLTRPPKQPEPWRDNPVFAKLKGVLTYISPLHLLDPTSPDFSAKSCSTLHDLTRFCHEKAMDAMFNLDVEQSAQAKGCQPSPIRSAPQSFCSGSGRRSERTGKNRHLLRLISLPVLFKRCYGAYATPTSVGPGRFL